MDMQMVSILNRWSGAVIWRGEARDLGAAVKAALAAGADLTDADLTDADLTGADLTTIKEDLHRVLSAAPQEVDAVLRALREGRVDGSVYEGECACLVGTIANARGCGYGEMPGLRPDAARPVERWFLAIRPGLPAEHPVVALTIGWIEEWQAAQAA